MNTLKIRIAVAVNAKGEWSAFGCHNADEGEAFDTVSEPFFGAQISTHIVTAEIPIPNAEIEGEVEKL